MTPENRAKQVIRQSTKQLAKDNNPKVYSVLVFIRTTAQYIIGASDLEPVSSLMEMSKVAPLHESRKRKR